MVWQITYLRPSELKGSFSEKGCPYLLNKTAADSYNFVSFHSIVNITPELGPVLDSLPKHPAQREYRNQRTAKFGESVKHISPGMVKNGIVWLSSDPEEEFFKYVKQDFLQRTQ